MRKQVTCMMALAGLFAWSVGAQAAPPSTQFSAEGSELTSKFDRGTGGMLLPQAGIDCCSGVSCNDSQTCQDAVCACDPFCCGGDWDANCAGPNNFEPGCSALDLCPECAGGPPPPDPTTQLCGDIPCTYCEDFDDPASFPDGCFLNCLPAHPNGVFNQWVATTANANGACGGCAADCTPTNAGCTMPSIRTANPFGGVGGHIRHGKLTTAPTGAAGSGIIADARVPGSAVLGAAQPIVPSTISAEIAINGVATADFRWQPQSIFQGLLTTVTLFTADDGYYSSIFIGNNPGGIDPGFLVFDFAGFWGPQAGFPHGQYVSYEQVLDPCAKYRCNDGGFGTCIEGDIGAQCFLNEDCGADLTIFACDKTCTRDADCKGDPLNGVPHGTCDGSIEYYQDGTLFYTSNIYAGQVPDQFAMFSNNRGAGQPAGMDLDSVCVSYGNLCPAAECGDDIREGDEECDGDDDNLCQGQCQPDCTCPEAVCGDGEIGTGEQCDVGNAGTCGSEALCVPAGETGPHGEAECTCVQSCTLDNPCELQNGLNGPFYGPMDPDFGGIWLYAGDAGAVSFDFCGTTGIDTLMTVYDAADFAVLAQNDDCCDPADPGCGAFGEGSTSNAPCYNNIVPGNWESCACGTSPSGIYLVQAAQVVGKGVEFWVNVQKKAECDGDLVGACCDRTTGECADNVLSGECDGDQLVWTENGKCELVECERATGACCDRTDGSCTDGVLPEDCEGAQLVWSKDTLCADADCAEATGACCNGLTGVCTDNVLSGACTGTQAVWSKDQSCSTVSCSAAQGACCNTAAGECRQSTQAECDGADDEWTKGADCSEVECDPPFIPTVSEWGLVIMALLLLAGAKVYFGRREESLA